MNAPSTAPSTALDDIVQKLGGAALERAKQSGFVYAFKARAYVEKNPFQALGIAFGVGYLVKSLFPGPISTLAVLGGAAYVAKKLA